MRPAPLSQEPEVAVVLAPVRVVPAVVAALPQEEVAALLLVQGLVASESLGRR